MSGSAVSTSSRTLAAQGKRARPPTLSLTTSRRSVPTNTILELETPVEETDALRFPISPASPIYSTPVSPSFEQDLSSSTDDLTKDLAVLEQLRLSVQKNLLLRPIRHSPTPPQSPVRPLSAASSAWSDYSQGRSASPSSSITSPSIYYTPISDARSPPHSAQYIGPGSSVYEQIAHEPPLDSPARAVDPASLASQLAAAPDAPRPLLIDTRPVGLYLMSRLRWSINVAIPTLILKRSRKPGNGFPSIDALRQFITSEYSRDAWDKLMRPGGKWDGNVVVFDEEMNEKERNNAQATAWALLPVLPPLLTRGCVHYLQGGMIAARTHSDLRHFIVAGEQEHQHHAPSIQIPEEPPEAPPPVKPSLPPKKGKGLFQLDTISAARSKALPEVEHSAGTSPLPMMPSAISSWNITDATPSPPPSQSVFPRPPPPRRPSLSALRRIDTKSAERLNVAGGLPKLQVRTVPMPTKSATLAAPPMNGHWPSSPRANSPSHLNLIHSNHTPPGSARLLSFSPTSAEPNDSLYPPSPSWLAPGTPRTPTTPMAFPRTPHTARPDDQPPTTEEPFPVFSVSTILPNFLYLGPELTAEEHVQELEKLGVKRILNIAVECDDDHGLKLRERFERYVRIPMRDTVEEDNITRGVREVCEVLDDASLHSAPTYVHCKAGKSRSVTAVMAYLIHANHWTLSRAYAFVLERRKGISPNIGFVSELMNFEEQELGGKSVGVVKHPTSAGGAGHDDDGEHDQHAHAGGRQGNFSAAVVGARRQGHLRESLPPAFSISGDAVFRSGPDVGDVGQEMEIRDAEGRYRHVRRAPVDATTLQPMRRVSKAGLENPQTVTMG